MLSAWLWPIHTGRTFFDLWSIEHVAWWIFFASNLDALWWKGRNWMAITFFLVVAIGWEVFECYYLEPRAVYADTEVWFNRWVSDLVMDTIGFMIGLWIARNV